MQCPSCRSPRVFPSRLKSGFERLRQRLTDKQPYRCHECNWRKWRDVYVADETLDVTPEDLRTGRAPQPVSPADFDQLDTSLSRH